MEAITREILWNVRPWMTLLLYAGSAAAVAVSLWRLYRRVRVWRRGLPAGLEVSWREALANVARWLAGRGKMRRDRHARAMHQLILWGFVVLFIGTTLVFLEHQTPLHFFYGPFYLGASLAIDLGGVAFLVGLGMAAHRRYLRREERLRRSAWIDAMLALMVAIGLSGFVLEAARIGVDMPRFEMFSVAGYGLALAMRGAGMGPGALEALHQGTWVGHALLSIAFFAVATVHFFRHAVVSLLGVALAPRRGTGRLRPDPLPATDALGAGTPAATVAELSWKDLLDADACTQCGRCTAACPATAAGQTLDPRGVVLGLAALIDREARVGNGSAHSALDFVPRQALWDCTTCGACVHECPVGIEVFDKIIDLRRRSTERGDIPDPAADGLESLPIRGNPWNHPPQQRTLWAEGLRLPVLSGEPGGESAPEYVYWIGCAGAYEPDGQAVSRAVVQILRRAGVDFAVLGSQESCTGDPARRLGDEALFQSCRRRNLERLRALGARRVLTHCAHCFNAFRNEYPEHPEAPEFEVIHHSQLIGELVAQGRVEMSVTKEDTITFHDPCYLGRHNDEYDAPRQILGHMPSVRPVEMARSRERSFCCGGGGGQMWIQRGGGERVENERLHQARQTGARTIATACPFCKVMFNGASGPDDQERPVEVKDIAELVAERMTG